MKISNKDTKFFAAISHDKNQIHLDKKYASNYFFKEPIVHGVNLINKAIACFLKDKNYKLIIKGLSINLKNYLVVGEEFEIKIYKKKIIVKNELNTKIEIDLEYEKINDKFKNNKITKTDFCQQYKINNLYNNYILNELIFISYYVGSINPGNGSLIHKININYSNKNNEQSKLKFKKQINNIFKINYCKNFFRVEVIASKLKPFKIKHHPYQLSAKALRCVKNKKILIFGSSSDVAKRLINKNFTNSCRIFEHSFRINFHNSTISKIELIKLEQKITKIKPDFIFYLSSPKIYNGNKKNLKLLKYYNSLFVNYFDRILNIVKKNNYKTKIFYPSSIFLNKKNDYKRLECYLLAKENAEKICKLKENNKIVSFFRLPQLISRSNYNIFGFYEGKKLSVLDKIFNTFFEQN